MRCYGRHTNFIAIHKLWATHDIFKFNDIHKQTLHNSFKINQTKVRHDIKSKQLASNLIGQCPCDSTDNKCISSNYLQDIFIFVKTYVKYNSRNTKKLATISFYLP